MLPVAYQVWPVYNRHDIAERGLTLLVFGSIPIMRYGSKVVVLWAVVATVALLARLSVLKGEVNRAPWSMLRRRSEGGGPVALAVALLLMVGSVLFRLNLSLSVGAQVLVFVGFLIAVDVVCRVVFLDRFRHVAMNPSPHWPDEAANAEQAK